MCRVNNRRCHNIWDRAALRRSGGLSGAQDAVNLSRAYRFLTSCAPVAKNDTPLEKSALSQMDGGLHVLGG